MQVISPNLTFNGVPLNGTYGNLDTGDGDLIGFNGDTDKSTAVVLSLNGAGNLIIQSNGLLAEKDPAQAFELIHFDTAAGVKANGESLLKCSVATGQLLCTSSGSSIIQLCPGLAVTDDLFIGNSVHDGCVVPKLNVIPVCSPKH